MRLRETRGLTCYDLDSNSADTGSTTSDACAKLRIMRRAVPHDETWVDLRTEARTLYGTGHTELNTRGARL